MRRLRFLAVGGSLAGISRWKAPPAVQQERVARLLDCSYRRLQEWERRGAKLSDAYSYVGLGYRMGGPERAQLVLEELAQLDGIEGVRVAAMRNGERK